MLPCQVREDIYIAIAQYTPLIPDLYGEIYTKEGKIIKRVACMTNWQYYTKSMEDLAHIQQSI